MKRSMSTFATVGLFLLLSGCASTGNPPTSSPAAVNTKCPVTGKSVDTTIATTDFRGNTVGFCCSRCIATWNGLTEADRQAKLTAAMPSR